MLEKESCALGSWFWFMVPRFMACVHSGVCKRENDRLTLPRPLYTLGPLRRIAMRKFGRLSLVAVSAAFCVVALACGGSDSNTPAASPSASAYGQYPPQQGYPQQYPPQQGQPTAGGYPPATAAPPATGAAPVAGGAMATPGPLALPCSSDSNCGLAHCNTQFQKCAFPCQNTAMDCIQGASCNTATGFCLPGGS